MCIRDSALGVVSLLAVVGGLKGTLFSMVKRVMQGLGGGLCLGVSVMLIWAGVLVAFSSGRSMPKRGFLLFTLLFFSVLGIIDLVSRVDVYKRQLRKKRKERASACFAMTRPSMACSISVSYTHLSLTELTMWRWAICIPRKSCAAGGCVTAGRR